MNDKDRGQNLKKSSNILSNISSNKTSRCIYYLTDTGGSPSVVRKAIVPTLWGTGRSTSNWGVSDTGCSLTDPSILIVQYCRRMIVL